MEVGTFSPASLTSPVSTPGDLAFQPDSIVNSALVIQNQVGAVGGLTVQARNGGAVFLSSSKGDIDFRPDGFANTALQINQYKQGANAPNCGLEISCGVANVNGVLLTPTNNANFTLSAGSLNFLCTSLGTTLNTLTLFAANNSVNSIEINAAATGQAPSIAAIGTDASVSLNLVTQGSGVVLINGAPIVGTVSWPLTNSGDEGFQPDGVANTVFNLQNAVGAGTGINLKGSAAGSGVAITTVSSGAAENLTVDAKGAGTLTFAGVSTGNVILLSSGAGSVLAGGSTTVGQAALTATAVASNVNGVTITGGATGTGPTIAATGSDGTQTLTVQANGGILTLSGLSVSIEGATGTSSVRLGGTAQISTNGRPAITATGVTSGVNGVTVTQSTTGNAPSIVATGSDAAVGLIINAKSTGTIVIGSVSTGVITLGAAAGQVNFGYAAGALGATTAAVNGNIGGAGGPSTAAQFAWLQVQVNGVAAYIAIWH